MTSAADEVMAAIRDIIITEKHGPKRPAASGISIYFPNSQLYGSPLTGATSYTEIAKRFSASSLWDDFLAYHYTGKSFDANAQELVLPSKGAAVTPPGLGKISASPIAKSSLSAAAGQPVTLKTDISGENIGYIYLFVGYLDERTNSILIADQDFLESSENRQVEGIFYPVWSEQGKFTMEFQWEPLLFAINDGQVTSLALFKPLDYGVDFEEATYAVDGWYQTANGEEKRRAQLLFRNGSLIQVLGFTGDDQAAAPREITPADGDQFTVLERWLDLDAQGKVVAVSEQEGSAILFGRGPIKWQELEAASGRYMIGFIIQDLDGQTTQIFTEILVE